MSLRLPDSPNSSIISRLSNRSRHGYSHLNGPPSPLTPSHRLSYNIPRNPLPPESYQPLMLHPPDRGSSVYMDDGWVRVQGEGNVRSKSRASRLSASVYEDADAEESPGAFSYHADERTPYDPPLPSKDTESSPADFPYQGDERTPYDPPLPPRLRHARQNSDSFSYRENEQTPYDPPAPARQNSARPTPPPRSPRRPVLTPEDFVQIAGSSPYLTPHLGSETPSPQPPSTTLDSQSLPPSHIPFAHLEPPGATQSNRSRSRISFVRPDSQAQADEPPSPPDGGKQAWLQVAVSWCLWFATWGLVNSYGVFQAYYVTGPLKQSSASAVSWIGSLQLGFFIAGTIFVGPAFDMGYVRSLVVAGSTLTVFGMFMTGLCNSYWRFVLAQGLCMGVGMSCLFTVSVAVVPAYFGKRRGLAMGICATGSSAGAIVFAITFEQLQPKVGFGWATRVLAFLLLASLLLPVIAIKKRVPSTSPRAIFDLKSVKQPVFVIYLASMLMVFMGLYIPFFYLEQFSTARNVLPDSKGRLDKFLIVFLNLGSLPGRLVPGVVADSIGPFNTIIPSMAISGIIAFTWINVYTEGGLVAFALFYGFFSGAVVSLVTVTLAAITPKMGLFGTRLGLLSICMAAGLLSGNPIAGTLIEANGTDFVRTAVFCGSLILESAVGLVGCRLLLKGWLVQAKV